MSRKDCFTAFADLAFEGIIVFSSAGKILFANRFLTHLSGYKPAELVNLHISFLFEAHDFNQLLQQAFQGASEALVKPKGQHCLPVIIKADSCVWEGQSVTFMLVQNVAQTRKDRDALRLYHAAAEACRTIIVLLDLSGAVAYANYALCRMLGYARPEALTGKPFSAFCGRSADECASILASAQRKKNAVWECVVLKKSGGRLCLRLTAHLLTDERGKPQYIRLVGSDVTRDRRMEERLRRLESQLQLQQNKPKKKSASASSKV